MATLDEMYPDYDNYIINQGSFTGTYQILRQPAAGMGSGSEVLRQLSTQAITADKGLVLLRKDFTRQYLRLSTLVRWGSSSNQDLQTIELLARVQQNNPLTCYSFNRDNETLRIQRIVNGVRTTIAEASNGSLDSPNVVWQYVFEISQNGFVGQAIRQSDNFTVTATGIDYLSTITAAGSAGFFMNARDNTSTPYLDIDEFTIEEYS